ncbi:MAG TPA: glycosyltransferase family 1 protein [Vicinamibacterales bacterium]
MRIGIDARELCGHTTGVGRYLSGLLSHWSGPAGRDHQFVLYAPEPVPMSLDSRQFPIRMLPGAGTWWEQVRLPRAAASDQIDAWFSPAYTMPMRIAVPSVVAIHDLSFVAHPEWFRFKEGIRRRWLTRASAARASAVLTISQFSKHELIDRLDVSASKIHVIPPGIDPGASRPDGRSAGVDDARVPMTGAPRILYAGSIFNRRHVTDLIRAFAPIARTHREARLDLVGDNRTYPFEDLARTIRVETLDQQVYWHRYVTDDQLGELYRSARAFAFLSEYEGLGLTPLEALAAGVPPVLLDTAVARESCGDAALYVEAGDLKATTAALNAALFDQAVRARVLAAAPRELAKYNWSDTARDTLSLLERVGAASQGEPS